MAEKSLLTTQWRWNGENILIAGCGYVGSALAVALHDKGYRVDAIKRSETLLPPHIQHIRADLTDLEALEALEMDYDHVVYAASADARNDRSYAAAYIRGLRNIVQTLSHREKQVKRIVFISSTSVYAQTNGEWVDEDSLTRPQHFSGVRILQAESLLASCPFKTITLRCGGIYGPHRTRLLDSVRSGQAAFEKGVPVFTNRIHRDDCAGIIAHLLSIPDPEPIYLAVDSEPVDRRTLLKWLAEQLDAPAPAAVAVKPEQSNKRCSNKRLLNTGYIFKYPTYKEGYGALLSESPKPN